MPRRIKRQNLPEAGTVFTREHKGKSLRATVVSADAKTSRVVLEVNGVTYPSPSAAAKAFTGHEINGWAFWGIDRGAC